MTKKDFMFLGSFRDTGINFFGVEQLRWYFVEPAPPKNGVHEYNWETIDDLVRKIEKEGGVSHITIVSSSPWATKVKTRSRVASPPEDGHWDDYKDFVRAIVERYDHDGSMDMPGLKYAHLYYQIEDEAENLSSWRGSDKEYLRLLATAREGARLADPKVKILTFSPNVGDFFDYLDLDQSLARQKQIMEAGRKSPDGKIARKLRFIETVFEEEGAYDIIALQYNYHYTGLPGTLTLIRKFSSKPFWIADAGSVPLLGRHQRVSAEYTRETPPNLSEKEIAAILSDRRHARHEEIKHWWEAEQARTAFKKIVTAAAMGAEHIFLQFIFDQSPESDPHKTENFNPWSFSGLLENSGDPRPVLKTIKLFNDKFRSFSNVKDLSIRKGTPYDWIMHYRFMVGEKNIDVVWTDGGRKKHKIDSEGHKLRISRVIEPESREADVGSMAGDVVEIDTSPIIIEMEK